MGVSAPTSPAASAASAGSGDAPLGWRLACAGTSLTIGLAQSLGLHLVSGNLSNIQGSIGATATEAGWLTTAYFATALSATMLLAKFRLHFGLRPFAVVGLLAFLAASYLHLHANSLATALAARAALGLAAAPLSTLAVYYMMAAMPRPLVVVGLLLGFGTLQLGMPLSRVISTDLLEMGQWHGLFVVDVALAMVSMAAISVVTLPAMPQRNAFCPADAITAPLYAGGLALICIVVSQGRSHWWTDASWLGWCLVAGIALLALYVVVELTRSNPMVDLRWTFSPYMLRFMASVILFRVVLSEQTTGVVGLMAALGQSNEQMQALFVYVLIGTMLGFGVAIWFAIKGWPYWLAIFGSALVVISGLMDAQATALTRPEQLYVSQTLLAVALAVFFSASCLLGFGPVIREGNVNIVSFLAAFSFAQFMGSLIGAAWVSSYVYERQQYHLQLLWQHLRVDDPSVGARLRTYTSVVSRVVGDRSEQLHQGLSLLAQSIQRESLVLAYVDLFHAVALIGTGMLLWFTFLMLRARRIAHGVAAAAAKAASSSATSASTPAVAPASTN